MYLPLPQRLFSGNADNVEDTASIQKNFNPLLITWQDRGAGQCSRGYILGCSQYFALRLRRSARTDCCCRGQDHGTRLQFKRVHMTLRPYIMQWQEVIKAEIRDKYIAIRSCYRDNNKLPTSKLPTSCQSKGCVFILTIIIITATKVSANVTIIVVFSLTTNHGVVQPGFANFIAPPIPHFKANTDACFIKGSVNYRNNKSSFHKLQIHRNHKSSAAHVGSLFGKVAGQSQTNAQYITCQNLETATKIWSIMNTRCTTCVILTEKNSIFSHQPSIKKSIL